MLIEFKRKNPLVGNRFFGFWICLEQILKMILDELRTAQNTHDLIDVPVEFHMTFKYGHNAICTDGSINLYFDNGLLVYSESDDPQMLLYPFEEQLDLPAMLVKKRYLIGREIVIVRIEHIVMLVLRYIGKDSAYLGGIVFSVTLSGESHSLIPNNVTSFQHILPGCDHKCRISLFLQNKERAVLFYLEQPCQNPVTAIEDITCQRLKINHIYCIDIVDCGIDNKSHGRGMCGNVKFGMKFDSDLRASESCTVEHRQAHVYGGRVKGIELATDAELSLEKCALRKLDQVVEKGLEQMPVLMVVTAGKGYLDYWFLPKSQIEGFLFMGAKYYCQIALTSAIEKLAEYQNKTLALIDQIPPEGLVLDIVPDSVFHYPLEFTLRQKFYNLIEYILAVVHGCCFTPPFRVGAKIAISKVRQHFQSGKSFIYL